MKTPSVSEMGRLEVLLCVVMAMFVRWAVSLHKYSGYNKPPMYGDFEAQRHWQEITVNLPPTDWYRNTSMNDLQYWGLDYPPLTAYHSWVCGHVAKMASPEWVSLWESRGLELYEHKVFMRSTVLVADVLVYMSALWATYRGENRWLCVALLYPGLILIDHGHFQYNCVSLGLFVWAVVCFTRRADLAGAAVFCLALNYKQMELYHAVPIFCFLFGKCLFDRRENGVLKFVQLGVVTAVTFAVCWWPFLGSTESALHVVRRVFPVGRGLYEDKVANVWCAVSVLVKINKLFDLPSLVQICFLATSFTMTPSSLNLLFTPDIRRLKLSLINVSLAFFLFSFHVHEKSILLAAVPLLLSMPEHSFTCLWSLMASTASMFPLLAKDGLTIPYFSTQVIFILLYYGIGGVNSIQNDPLYKKAPKLWKTLFSISFIGFHIIILAQLTVAPPKRWPDLFPLGMAIYSCAHFMAAFLYFNYAQLKLTEVSVAPKKKAN